MGAWGEGLYDDEACEVKDSRSILAKLPAQGERILEILLKTFGPRDDLAHAGAPAEA